jgi:hypothetical protein
MSCEHGVVFFLANFFFNDLICNSCDTVLFGTQ